MFELWRSKNNVMIEAIQIKNKLSGNPNQPPQFAKAVQKINGEELMAADPKALRALISLMDMNAVMGGAASHYGGPAAFAELVSALHALAFDEANKSEKPWYELFHIVNDAGHCENGLYALKALYGMAGLDLNSLKKFRSIESPLTGHGEAHCFPEGVFISNGPLGSAFPQSQGLALGDALTKKARVTVTFISDGASMEGEARESFAAIPGLAKAGKLAPYVLIISDNNTKLSGRIDKDSFSMQPTFEALKALGWNVLELQDGNNLQKCIEVIGKAIQAAKLNPLQPVAIHAKTIKGIGTKKTAESSSGGHGFPLKSPQELSAFISEIYGEEVVPSVFKEWIEELIALEIELKKNALPDSGEKIQKGIAAAMIRAGHEGYPIISVTSDLPGSTGVADFRKEFPNHCVDVGVAESNMISTAAGLSKVGFIPVVDTFAQFGVTKGALPFIMASLSEAPMIAIFSHTGFQDAADGASHQALSYLAMTASIPNVRVVCLSCSEEADALVTEALKEFYEKRKKGEVPQTTVFFLGRENFPKSYAPAVKYQLSEPTVLKNVSSNIARKVTLLTSGSLVSQTLSAAEKLEKDGYGVQVVHLATVQPIAQNMLKTLIAKTDGRLVTVEDHQVIGGLGQMVVHALAESGLNLKVRTLGVKGKFGQSAYNAIDLYRLHGLDSESIQVAAKSLF
ncbi:MAG: transketolase C-terminal domain-containing protein [Bdellovibrionia bacterium]